MLAFAGRPSDIILKREAEAPRPREVSQFCGPDHLIELSAGDALFRDGERRTSAYRIISGGLCHHMTWPDGRHDVIEFVFAGDIVGFGHLPRRMTTAQALVDTVVAEITADELDDLISGDAALAARVYDMADREFELARERAASPDGNPMERIAAVVLALDDGARREGLFPTLLGTRDQATEDLAGMLDIDPASAALAVSELIRRDVLSEEAGALMIADRHGLELLSGPI